MVSFATCVLAQTESSNADLSVGAIYYSPSDDESYDNGFGGEAQIRFWQNANVGFGLALGAASWQINDFEEIESDGVVAVGTSIDGDVTLIPVGGSIFFRPTINEKVSMTIEAGVRYVIVDSQIDVEIAAANAFGAVAGRKDSIEIDDGVVGVIGVNIEGHLSKQTSMFAGLGYQFDLSKGDAEYLGEDFGENELEALLIKAGFIFPF